MLDTHHLPIVIVLLAAAVVIVALFQRMRASPVLGFLVAGAIIGPGGAGFVGDTAEMHALAESGVMFLLFIIGLELSWERLRAIRKQAFAIGIAQVVVTTIILALALRFYAFPLKTSVIVGGGLALSSTALVMQLITEHNQKASQLGRLSLAILLMQDLAVVPLLALIPALAPGQGPAGMTLLTVGIKALLALAIIVGGGRLLLRPFYRLIASQGTPEIFTALTLLVVLGTGWLTNEAGLSLALGAFMAGLLIAETEYRHQVEADVMPYKGLFLGLFFMTVGMSADLHLAWQHLPLVLGLALGLMAVKALIIFALCRSLRMGATLSIQASLLLSQGGEFAFVLFQLALLHGFITPDLARILTLAVAVSMALTPFAAWTARTVTRRIEHTKRRKAEDAIEETTDLRDHVIILGFGRVGQTIAKLLSAEGIHYIALDMQISTVSKAKKIGLPVYYGDGSRREVLHALGIERAAAAIVTVNEPIAAEATVRALRASSPSLPVVARGRDLARVLSLEAAGADIAISEMFEASLQLGGALLNSMGIAQQEISRIIQLFRDSDYALARGTLEVSPDVQQTAYGKMLSFQKSVVKGALITEDDSDSLNI
jgi:CPA2 family monovalent cation:H+ antiporter-2